MKSFILSPALSSALLSALALSLVHGHAAADTAHQPGWSTSAELGAISTSGNTVGTSVTGKLDTHQELAEWSNEYILAGFFNDEEVSQSDGEKTRERSAQRLSASAKAAYKLLQDHDTLFVLGTHVNDKFGAYTRYSTLGVGYGTQWYKSELRSLDVEIGPGYFSGARAGSDTENEGGVQRAQRHQRA
jgi:putative salt-induced outer membrane protein YdiY